MLNRTFILIYILLVSYNAGGMTNILQLTENSKVSLLTCSPNSDAIYALFGHTSLRVQDTDLNLDVVFDYGVFDFSSDNFIYRFVKGETDYRVKDRLFQHFLAEYSIRESGVQEQVLNLTLEERQRVFEALVTNLKPENRIYRYNFFYDNCSTRPRDIIEENVEGKIEFKTFKEEQTYRDLLEECLVLTPWTRFGINLVIASGADKTITDRQKDFLPLYLLKAFDNAFIVDKVGSKKKLVLEEKPLLDPDSSALELQIAKENNYKTPNYPLYVGILLLLVTLLISYLSYKKDRKGMAKVFDIILFVIAGCAGCIIFFLMFFSEHPCVDANWNLVWLNPLALIFALVFFVKLLSKYVISYHFINFVALSLFVVSIPIIPQTIELAFIPYILTLLIRSGSNVLEYKAEKASKKK